MALYRHTQPLGDLRPRYAAELGLTVSRHDGRRPDPRGQHPDCQPRHQRGLTNTATRTDRQPHRVKVNLTVVCFDVVAQLDQNVALPFTRAFEVLKGRIRFLPRER